MGLVWARIKKRVRTLVQVPEPVVQAEVQALEMALVRMQVLHLVRELVPAAQPVPQVLVPAVQVVV